MKAEVLVRRQPSFELLETMRWDPGDGYAFLELHLERLSRSAEYFAYCLDMEAVRNRLTGLAAAKKEPMRVRLLLDKRGKIELQSFPISVPSERRKVKIMLAAEPVSADNIWLFHKTTHRRVYEAARSKRPEADEVILWNSAGELTEATMSNIVLDLDGRLVTPPVSCGLLDGTFRRHLLETGEISEKRLTVDDLYRCRKVYLINSVRLWQEALVVDPV